MQAALLVVIVVVGGWLCAGVVGRISWRTLFKEEA